MQWTFVCNGGPNDTTVGGQAVSLGQAIGGLEEAMKALGATKGSVFRNGSLQNPLPVASEEDAGDDGGCE